MHRGASLSVRKLDPVVTGRPARTLQMLFLIRPKVLKLFNDIGKAGFATKFQLWGKRDIQHTWLSSTPYNFYFVKKNDFSIFISLFSYIVIYAK